MQNIKVVLIALVILGMPQLSFAAMPPTPSQETLNELRRLGDENLQKYGDGGVVMIDGEYVILKPTTPPPVATLTPTPIPTAATPVPTAVPTLTPIPTKTPIQQIKATVARFNIFAFLQNAFFNLFFGKKK